MTLTALLLSGCQTMERHPVATSIVGSVLVTSLALSSHHGGGGHGPQMSEPLIAAPEVDCSKVSCK